MAHGDGTRNDALARTQKRGHGGETENPRRRGQPYVTAILTTVRRAPLFAVPRLRRLASDALFVHRAETPGKLWAYAVQRCTVRLIVGPTDVDTLDAFVEQLKAWVATPVLQAIRSAEDETLDAVLHYNPVWGGAIYRLWAVGHHRVLLWNAYRLSQALYTLGTLRADDAIVWVAEA